MMLTLCPLRSGIAKADPDPTEKAVATLDEMLDFLAKGVAKNAKKQV